MAQVWPHTSWLESEHLRSYAPRAPALFAPARIILAKGAYADDGRRGIVDRICRVFPEAEVVHRPAVPHNRIDLGIRDALELHYRGKQTLVLGEHRTAVRFSREEGNTCPNYWHFSPYAFCPYDCRYCYLAGTPGVRFSPTVKIFLNLPEMLSQIDHAADAAGQPVAFYLGKLQDGLALDPLTGFMRLLVPFFAAHRWARLRVLTKSAQVEQLLDLDHQGHTVLSWSLNPPEVSEAFENGVPSVEERVEAMRSCALAGYPVRAVIMPIVPVEGWQHAYRSFLGYLLDRVQPERITLGGICIYSAAQNLMERKLGAANTISGFLDHSAQQSSDGRTRYPRSLRREMYAYLVRIIQKLDRHTTVSLCLEEEDVIGEVGLAENRGRCNCVL